MNLANPSIFIVDDDKDICLLLSALMEQEGIKPQVAYDGETALKMIRRAVPDVLLVDVRLPRLGGMEVLRQVKEVDSSLPVVLITAYAEISASVAAIKEGAFDYIAKPFDHAKVISVVRQALADRQHRRSLAPDHTQEAGDLRQLMGPSETVTRIIGEVSQVAPSDFSVIIQGETGSGKELVARTIHQLSRRAQGPFLPVDCGAIPEGLIESELFGYRKGAFTGAVNAKAGKFEAAQGGSIFLDELANLPLGSQAKLLRALQEKTVLPLGALKPSKIDVRLITAANQDLATLVQEGRVREDLYFRLHEFAITVPPLRERREDIPYLARRFRDITSRELNKQIQRFSERAMEALQTYNWPGNVRQLKAVIRRAVLLADDLITEKHLDIKSTPAFPATFLPRENKAPWREQSLKEIVCRRVLTVEREVLTQVLTFTHGNKAKAARLLQIDYKTIHSKIKQFGIKIIGGGYD